MIEGYLQGPAAEPETPPVEARHVSPDFPFEKPYPFQESLWKSLLTSNRLLIHAGRQMGLTTILAHYAVVQMSLNPGIHILFATPSGTSHVADTLLTGDEISTVTFAGKTSFTHRNGSMLFGHPFVLPKDRTDIRGKSFDLLIADNIDLMPFSRTEDFAAILPTAGRIVLAGNVARGLLRTLWQSAGPDWNRLTLPWHIHPERDANWRHGIERSIGSEKFAEEFGCVFPNDEKSPEAE
jgi:hypothetical protein